MSRKHSHNVAKSRLTSSEQKCSNCEGNLSVDLVLSRYLRMLYRMKDLEKIQGPKIVLASLSSLDVGWSHQLLQDWGEGDKNIIILPDRGLPGSMTRKLYEEWDRNAPQQQLNSIRLPIELQLDIPIIVRVG